MRILLDNDSSLSASPGPSPTEVLSSGVLDALSAHIAVIDRSGRIVAINDAWKQFTVANGASTGTAGIGCNYLEACRTSLSPENFNKGRQALQGIELVLRREAKEFEIEYPCHAPDCRRWFLLRCTPVSDNEHAVICHIDITSRKLAEEKLRNFAEDIENQLLERTRLEKVLLQGQKLDAVAHLAGGIAHDFNNILAAIMGYSELILKKTEDADAIKYLQGTLKACSRAKDLIQQILTFSRKSKVNLMPLDLRFILKETLPLIRASLPNTVTVLDRLDTIAAATIRGNPTELRQVFINLCANGVQAMRGTGGMLIVRLADVLADQHLRERCPRLELNRRYVMLSIRDTGTGIAAEHMGSIFEPYFSTKIQEKGTGLGLAVVDGIVRNHQGGVVVESFPGHGTTFSLYFPFVDREEVATVSQIRQNGPNAAPHILIVDDEAAILQILRKALESKGYTTTCSQFAKEAMTLFRRSPGSYDLVLLDLTMPEARGDRLAKIIKKIRRDIPIVLCSGYTERLIRPIATNHVDRILRKPVPYAELTATLEEMLAGKIPAGS